MSHLTDEEMALQVQHGETYWFAVLVERYEAKMVRYAKKFLFGYDDTQDVVQDIFIKAYTNIQSFDPNRRFSPWLYRIAHNEFINAIRKKGRDKVSFFDPDVLFPNLASEEEPKEHDHVELKKALDVCLDKIDIKYREPLVLYYYEEQDYQEIAEIMRIPISTVGVRIKRGKDALKKIMNETFPEYEHE
jgi:RNA polymerase sigma-70 factor (ECF subfamily)